MNTIFLVKYLNCANIAARIAQMAELVDALDSKSGYRKVVQVRFLFWAQKPASKKQVFLCDWVPNLFGKAGA
jgi:hypothetical protein